MLTKRLKICIATGAILGVFCIVGALVRSGFQRDAIFLFALWYNRLIMGLMIGLAGGNLGWPKNNWPRSTFWFSCFSCFLSFYRL